MKTKAFVGMAVIGVAALLAGCDSKSATQSEPTASAAAPFVQAAGRGMMDGGCPMQVPTTTVKSADVEGGVALTFTTSIGDVAELRQRVRRMVEMHNHHLADGGMMMGGHGRGVALAEHEHWVGARLGQEAGGGRGMMMGGGMTMPAATASVEDIDGGARLVLRPKDAGNLEPLRKHARMRSERMASGECPMMSSGAQEAAPPPSAGGADHDAHYASPQGN